MSTELRWLSYEQAARKVGRSPRVIRLWRRSGMVMGWHTHDDGSRIRVVREDVLLTWFRDRLKASPIHHYRMRKQARELGLPQPARPVWTPKAPKTDTEDPQETTEGLPEPDPVSESHWRRGAPQFDALAEAMKIETAGCDGLDAFTADGFQDPETKAMLAGICAACPLVDLCRDVASIARPTAGFWAGRPWSAYQRQAA